MENSNDTEMPSEKLSKSNPDFVKDKQSREKIYRGGLL